jgi:glucose/arabinose dehydrogenase
VYSYGHRNAQVIVYDPLTTIFSNEQGLDGGAEINIIQGCNHYGWPVITQGKNYLGSRISPFKVYPNMHTPF